MNYRCSQKIKIKWEGHKYEYRDPLKLKEIKLKPQISISNLLDSLKNIDFGKLISQNKIENFKDDVDDGTVYTLEISYAGFYKILQYHSPEEFAKNEINNKRFLNLIKLLEKYFQ